MARKRKPKAGEGEFPLPSGSPKGAAWYAAIGSKGIVCAVAQTMEKDGKRFALPSFCHTGEPLRDGAPVVTGTDVSIPWSGKGNASGANMGAYVGTRQEKVTLLPLGEALEAGLVVPVAGMLAGSVVDCFMPQGWTPAERLPQYIGTTSNGPRGRFEPYSHPDKNRRRADGYADIHCRPSFAPVKEGAK